MGDVAAGAEGQAQLALTVDAATPTEVRHIFAAARITDDGTGAADLNRRNNGGFEAITLVHQVPDLSVQLDDGEAESVEAGGAVVYTLHYANQGLVDAAGVVLSFRLPTSTTLDAANSTVGWACEEGICTLALGDLAKDSSGSATLAVTVDAEFGNVRRLRATATITDDGSSGVDANPRDNRDGESTAVTTPAGNTPFGHRPFGLRWFRWFGPRFRR